MPIYSFLRKQFFSNAAPSFWSECSVRALHNSLSKGVDYCLKNQPDKAFGGARCGNSIVEPGEECDCGTEVCFFIIKNNIEIKSQCKFRYFA